MKAVIYSRVSTQEQNTDNQIDTLKIWANAKGLAVIEVYQESESAWKEGHQHELARLLDNAHQRRFNVVLVWSLDRLTRQGPLAILQLVNKLSKRGVKVLSYQESWTEAPGELGDLLYSLVGWVAQFESKRRSERTKAGLARIKKEGKALGRPPGAKDTRKRKKRNA